MREHRLRRRNRRSIALTNARLVVRLLGDATFEFDGKPWKLNAPPRSFDLMALISLARAAPISRASLALALWPDELETSGRANLRRHLHRLAQALPPVEGIEWIVSPENAVTWNPDAPVWVDVVAFEEACADPARATEAIPLYGGDLLARSYEECLLAHRERLRNAYVDACRSVALEARAALDFAEAIRNVDRILALDEWREDALRLAMTIRYESGDRTAALAQFDRFAARLKAEMGVSPMPETLALRDAILSNRSVAGVERLPANDFGDAQPREAARMPFVGREAERKRLDTAWRHSAQGRGTTLFIGGEPGIGKSRLVAEFGAEAALQGGRTLAGVTSNPQAFPYEPIVDALRRSLPLLIETPIGDPWLGILAELLPELHAAFPEMKTPGPLDAARAQSRLFEALARVVEHLSRARPLLFILEDVHWAQPATLDAIEALARRIGAARALLVLTYRTSDVPPGHRLETLRRKLQAENRAGSVELGPLDAESIFKLSGEAQLGAAVHERSGGNPLFAGQLLSNYAESGSLGRSSASIAETILGRVDALETTARTVAQAAAAIGNGCASEDVARMLGWSENDVLDALGTLIDRGMVRFAGSSAFSYVFAHSLIESTIYDATDAAARVVYHRRIAQILEPQTRDDRQGLASIARHWQLGGEPERAAKAYAAAANAANAVYARAEATAYANKAIDAGENATLKYEMLLLLSRATRGAEGPDRWKTVVDDLAAIAETMDDDARFTAREERVAYFSQVGGRAEQRETIEEMLELAERLPGKRGAVLFQLGLLEFQLGNLAPAVEQLETALGMCDDAMLEARIRGLLIAVLLRLARYDEAMAQLDMLRALAAREQDDQMQLRYLQSEEQVALELGDAPRAYRAGKALLEIADRVEDDYQRTHAHSVIAFGALRVGTAAETRTHLRTSIEICERVGYAPGAASMRSNEAVFELHLGNAQRALELFDAVVPDLEASGAQLVLCVAQFTRSEAYSWTGDPERAVECARSAVEIAEKIGAEGLLAAARSRLGSAYCLAGEIDRGLDLLADAAAMRRKYGPPTRLVEALGSHLCALLDDGRTAQAASIARELETLANDDRIVLWRPAFVFHQLARAALAAGDEQRARAHTARAIQTLEEEIARIDDDECARGLRDLPYNRIRATSS